MGQRIGRNFVCHCKECQKYRVGVDRIIAQSDGKDDVVEENVLRRRQWPLTRMINHFLYDEKLD